jgi:hypothetical protein
VQGIDISPIQPVWVPPNVSFYVDDCEQDWLVSDLDLAHFRFMAIILKDVPKVLDNAYKYVSFSSQPPSLRYIFPIH